MPERSPGPSSGFAGTARCGYGSGGRPAPRCSKSIRGRPWRGESFALRTSNLLPRPIILYRRREGTETSSDGRPAHTVRHGTLAAPDPAALRAGARETPHACRRLAAAALGRDLPARAGAMALEVRLRPGHRCRAFERDVADPLRGRPGFGDPPDPRGPRDRRPDGIAGPDGLRQYG